MSSTAWWLWSINSRRLLSMKACSFDPSKDEPAKSKNLNAWFLSNLSDTSVDSKSYSLAPRCVMSEARDLAALTSCTLIGGGGASSELECREFLLALLRIVASFNNSWTALPSEAYSFLVFNFSLAFAAIRAAISVKNSTLSFSNSTRSDKVVSGSYSFTIQYKMSAMSSKFGFRKFSTCHCKCDSILHQNKDRKLKYLPKLVLDSQASA
mmetsp:Transcript_22606/g.42181  ORF Transcript_22606/g.42181 Transcript_22606/m.42181 type:complete len:210 (-) Transcript_22606:109-738(-)